MGTISVPGYIYWPTIPAPILVNTNTLDAENEAQAVVFRLPASGTLTEVGFQTSTITTGSTLTVRLESLDSNGDPSGNLYVANANGTIEIASGDDNVVKYASINGGSGVSVTAGDWIAFVLIADATFVGNLVRTYYSVSGVHQPYTNIKTSGTWGATKQSGSCPLSVTISSAMYIPIGCYAPITRGSVSWMSTTNPDYRGSVFTLPSTKRVIGAYFAYIDMDCDTDFILFDSDATTVLDTVSSLDTYRSSTAGNSIWILFTNPHILKKNKSYRLVMLPKEAVNITAERHDYTLSGSLSPKSACPFSTFSYTTCHEAPTGTGSWTDTATSILPFALICDQLIEPASGSFLMV